MQLLRKFILVVTTMTLIANLAPADQNLFVSNPPRTVIRTGTIAFNGQALMPASLVPHMQIVRRATLAALAVGLGVYIGHQHFVLEFLRNQRRSLFGILGVAAAGVVYQRMKSMAYISDRDWVPLDVDPTPRHEFEEDLTFPKLLSDCKREILDWAHDLRYFTHSMSRHRLLRYLFHVLGPLPIFIWAAVINMYSFNTVTLVLVSIGLALIYDPVAHSNDVLEKRTDLLTRLPNRNALELEKTVSTVTPSGVIRQKVFNPSGHLPRLYRRATQNGRQLAFLVIDVDDFKSVNDKEGHDTGDKLLKAVARVIRAAMPPGAEAYRWGGEEFLVLIPGTDAEAAVAIANVFRENIGKVIIYSTSRPIRRTVSIGVSISEKGGLPEEQLESKISQTFAGADAALYKAKGPKSAPVKNRVIFESMRPVTASKLSTYSKRNWIDVLHDWRRDLISSLRPLTDEPAHYVHLYVYGWIGLFLSVASSGLLHAYAMRQMPGDAYLLQLALVLPLMLAVRAIVYVLQQRALHLEIYDETTGVKTRNSLGLNDLEGDLPKLFAAKNAAGKPLTFIYFDANRFKEVNDTYGHLVGNEVLKELARTAVENIRPTDEVGRMGGDEFLAMIHGDVEEGRIVAENIRKAMEKKVFRVEGSKPFSVTSSFGVAAASPEWAEQGASLIEQVNAAINAADVAMYVGKKTRRNQVVVNNLSAPLKKSQPDIAWPLPENPVDKILRDSTPRETLYKEYAGYLAQPAEMTAVHLDVDDLKMLNDRGGHSAGDKALRAIVEILLNHLPEGYRINRLGSNQFGFIIKEGVESAARLAETLRQAIEQAALGVTARFVVVEKSLVDSPTWERGLSWLQTIDEALYNARINGRNRVTVVPSEHSLETAA